TTPPSAPGSCSPPSCSARPSTCAPASAGWTWPAATATPPVPPPAAAGARRHAPAAPATPPRPPPRRFCQVPGIDYVPALLDRARQRAAAEGLEATFQEADAEALPFPAGSFDAVLSTCGAMFAPDQERTAGELLRVCRPG